VWFRNSEGSVFFAKQSQCRGNTNELGEPLDFVSRGAHLQAQYVLPHFLPPPVERMEFELLARFDWVDANSPYTESDPLFGGGQGTPGYIAPANYTDSDNPPTRWRLTFGLNFFPSGQEQIRLGINYQLNRESENVVTADGTFAGINNDIFWIQLTAGI
jgi:hypothetical protein